MDKNELQKKLNEIKSRIKANSKDAHFAEKLIDDLITTKSMIGTEPIELNVGKRIDSYSGNTFEIVKTNRGMLYNEYGHYAVFVEPSNKSLYETLEDFVVNREHYANLDGDEKEHLAMAVSAITYCITLPRFVFSDDEFTFNIATEIVSWLKEQYDKRMNMPLQDETIEQDAEFMEAAIELDNIKNQLTTN